MPTQNSDYERIRNFLTTIKKSPKRHGVYFFFQEDEDVFIVEGERVKMLPPRWDRFNRYDEFFIRVDLKRRVVMFTAWDIKDWSTGEFENEVDDIIPWDDAEKAILSFFSREIENLTESPTPYSGSHRDDVYSHSRSEDYRRHSHGSSWTGHNSNYYITSKERDAFFDKVKVCFSDNRASHAVDCVNEELERLIGEKKFDEIDSILRMVQFEKLNIPVMLAFLKGTQKNAAEIFARAHFFDKVKTYISKTKPSFAKVLLDGLEKAAA